MHYSQKREKLLDKILIMVYNIYSLLTLIFKAKYAQVSTFLHHLQCSLGYYQEIDNSLEYSDQIHSISVY